MAPPVKWGIGKKLHSSQNFTAAETATTLLHQETNDARTAQTEEDAADTAADA